MVDAVADTIKYFGWIGSKMHYLETVITEGRDDPLYIAYCGQSKELSRVNIITELVFNHDELCGNCIVMLPIAARDVEQIDEDWDADEKNLRTNRRKKSNKGYMGHRGDPS